MLQFDSYVTPHLFRVYKNHVWVQSPGMTFYFIIFQLDLSEKVKQDADAKLIKNHVILYYFDGSTQEKLENYT